MISRISSPPRRRATPAAGAEPRWPQGVVPVPPSRERAGIPRVTGDIVDEWGRQSFPASDPPANW